MAAMSYSKNYNRKQRSYIASENDLGSDYRYFVYILIAVAVCRGIKILPIAVGFLTLFVMPDLTASTIKGLKLSNLPP